LVVGVGSPVGLVTLTFSPCSRWRWRSDHHGRGATSNLVGLPNGKRHPWRGRGSCGAATGVACR